MTNKAADLAWLERLQAEEEGRFYSCRHSTLPSHVTRVRK